MSDAEPRPPAGTSPTAAPSVGARVVGMLAILAAGAAGGFIGWSYVDLQCDGDCDLATAGGGLLGAVIGAVGVAVVVVLALRAMSEWQTVERRRGPIAPQPPANAGRRQGPGSQPPRVT